MAGLAAIAFAFFLIGSTRTHAAEIYKLGSRGHAVLEIQRVLNNEGLYHGSLDGIFGAETERAVKDYQQRYGLATDGKAGPVTLEKMGLLSSPTADITANDIYLLSRIISAEARGEPYLGQVAVGAVVLNRVKHPSFPGTIAGVIYQNGAFSAVTDGQFDEPVSDEARRAAYDVLNGVNPVPDAIYYYNPQKATNAWIRSRPIIKTIGLHVFCT